MIRCFTDVPIGPDGSRVIRILLVVSLLLGTVNVSLAIETLGGEFSLTDQNGEEFRLEQLRGRYVLLYFGYLNCPDVCPLELNTIAQTIRMVGGDQVAGVFVTLDPKRDTAEKIGKYVGFFHPDIVGLTGTEEEIRRVAEQYNIRYRHGAGPNYTVDHAIHVVVLDRAGAFRAISPFGASADQLSAVIRGLD